MKNRDHIAMRKRCVVIENAVIPVFDRAVERLRASEDYDRV